MTTVGKGRACWAVCAVLAGALQAAALAGDVAVTPTSADGVVVNISPAAVGQDMQATIAVNASAPPQVGQQTVVSEALTYEYTWSLSPDGSIGSVDPPPSQQPSSQSGSSATGSFPTPGQKTISVTVTIGGTADYSWVDADGNTQTVTLGVSGSAQFQIDVDVYQADAISITPLDKFSIDQTGILVSARVTCFGNPAAGVTVSFCSDKLTLNPATATTDATGQAMVTAHAGSSPSACADCSYVEATVDDGLGSSITATEELTVVEVKDPTTPDPSILVGGYDIDSLYSVVLTFSVTPVVQGVPVTFSLPSGPYGVNIFAQLEDQDTVTNGNGLASVRVRSGDLEGDVEVRCTFEASYGHADVTFAGITGLSTGN